MWKPMRPKPKNKKSASLYFKRLQNKSGIVLVAIIVVTLVMSILAIGIMSTNLNQAFSSKTQVDRIRAEELAKGAFWFNFTSLRDLGTSAVPPTETIDGITYTFNRTSTGVGPNGTTPQDIQVDWQP